MKIFMLILIILLEVYFASYYIGKIQGKEKQKKIDSTIIHILERKIIQARIGRRDAKLALSGIRMRRLEGGK